MVNQQVLPLFNMILIYKNIIVHKAHNLFYEYF